MKVVEIEIDKVKLNKKNPRVIKDEKFQKLVKSIKEFPEMLKLRPIVVDGDMMVLGGNMRLKACKEAGLETIPIIIGSDLTEKERREFLIKDNVNYGEWDFIALTDYETLEDWGMDLPDWAFETDSDEWDEMDDFLAEVENELEKEKEDKKSFEDEDEVNQSVFRASYLQMTFESSDFDFIKKVEGLLLEKTETDNLSDAVLKIIKNL